MKLKKPNSKIGNVDIGTAMADINDRSKRSLDDIRTIQSYIANVKPKHTKADMLDTFEEIKLLCSDIEDRLKMINDTIVDCEADNVSADNDDCICVEECANNYVQDWVDLAIEKGDPPERMLEEGFITKYGQYVKARMLLDLYGKATYSLLRWSSGNSMINKRLYKKHLKKYVKTHKIKPYSRII